jgi:ribosomal protein S6E (S10)
MIERLRAMMVYANEIECTFEDRGIGSVIVGAVENYIRISRDNDSAADFGIVAFYNVAAGVLIQGVTQGVPMQLCYLTEARDEGNLVGKSAGYVTYGNILKKHFKAAALRVYGSSLDIGSNWHEVVCGRSRYCILMETCQDLLGRHKSLFEGSSGSLQIQ